MARPLVSVCAQLMATIGNATIQAPNHFIEFEKEKMVEAVALNKSDPPRVSLTAAIIINSIFSLVLLCVSIINIYFIFAAKRNVFSGEVDTTEGGSKSLLQTVVGSPPKKWIAWGLVACCVMLVFTMFWQTMALSHVNMLECKSLEKKDST